MRALFLLLTLAGITSLAQAQDYRTAQPGELLKVRLDQLHPTQAVVGYDQMQTSEDSGPGASTSKSSRHAIGAEVVYPIMSAGVFLKAAAYKEYSAGAGTGPEPKGSLLRFTFVKAF